MHRPTVGEGGGGAEGARLQEETPRKRANAAEEAFFGGCPLPMHSSDSSCQVAPLDNSE